MVYADFHVHSRFSRATSRAGNLAAFTRWAALKGLGVVATGDFTHPEWIEELKAGLIEEGRGLFRLNPRQARAVQAELPAACRPGESAAAVDPRFIFQAEVSTIYKRDGKTRKVHHVILAPGFREAEKLNARLAKIGNLKSDGRPILGLDSRHLLELVLESGSDCMLIPAHIWTPWFSALGSKSGFDSIADCYGDLAAHVFAVETGLSSDPPMNWRVSTLDRYRLVSNSDAHSPEKLGREATVLDDASDYGTIQRALETGAGYGGTVEFFPEEGKYHADGHRVCGVCWEPEETRRHGGRCTVCGKPVTVGVQARVAELADRPPGGKPAQASAFRSFVPLKEILGELLGCAASTGKVAKAWETLIAELGPELPVLERATEWDLERLGPPRLGEALTRMRSGRVIREPGYDGEYGAIRLFGPGELAVKPRPRRKDPAPPRKVVKGGSPSGQLTLF